MTIRLYKEDGVPLNPALKVKISSEAIPSGYSFVNNIEEIDQKYFFDSGHDYKVIRDCIKGLVSDAGSGNVQTGFDTLSPEEKQIAALHNIGTGTQIAETIPDLKERDQSSFDYLSNMAGRPSGVRSYRATWLEAATWSRLKKDSIEVAPGFFVTAPELIYSIITISDPNPAAGEIGGNLLDLFVKAGISGLSDGDATLGIIDFVLSTPGTRFEFAGLATHPFLSGLIPGGFNDMAEFKSYLFDILKYGLFEIGKTTIV